MKRLLTSFIVVLLMQHAVFAADVVKNDGRVFDRALVTRDRRDRPTSAVVTSRCCGSLPLQAGRVC